MGLEGTLEVTHLDGVVLVVLHGEHDIATERTVRSVLEDASRPGYQVVVDLSEASFIDSTVVHALGYASVNADRLSIVAPEDCVCRRLIDLVGLDGHARMFETCEAALDWAARSHKRRHVKGQIHP